MRTTSIEAYEAIRASGVLGARTWQTYEALFKNGPLTQAECWLRMDCGNLPQRSITPRFAQLLRLGFVRYLLTDDGAVLKRKCAVSGKRCMVWDVTTAATASEAKLPVSRLARATERIRQLESQLARANSELDGTRGKLARWGRPPNTVRQARALERDQAPRLL